MRSTAIDSTKDEYYLTIEPEERKQYMETVSGQEPEIRETVIKLRQELFDMRYSLECKKKEKLWIDAFMKIWLDLSFLTGKTRSARSLKKGYEEITQKLEDMKAIEFRNTDEVHADAMYNEFRHVVRLFIYSGENNRSYSKYFELVRIPPERLKEKINRDVKNVAIDYPRAIGLDAVFPELSQAAEDELEYYNSRTKVRKTL